MTSYRRFAGQWCAFTGRLASLSRRRTDPSGHPERAARAACPTRGTSRWAVGAPSPGQCWHWLGGCSVVLTLVALLTGCGGQAKATHQVTTAEAYTVAYPTVSDAVMEREYVAEIRAARYAEVRARVRGIVEVVAVDEGQAVKAGQHLFSIGAHDLEQELVAAKAAAVAAQAELQAARLELNNSQLLFDKNVISAAELAMTKAKVAALEAKVRELKAASARAAVELGYARITAPFSGVVNRIPNRVGSAIAEEELLTTIADTSEVYAYFRLSERDYLQQRSEFHGDRPLEVWLKLADGSRFSRPGVVDAVANEFDRETGSIAVRARLDNENAALKHGSSGKIVLETELPEAILVPQEATFEVQGNIFVYAVDADDVVHTRKVVPKLRLDEHFVVESGLTAADRFVLEGTQKLSEGVKIQALPHGSAPKEG